MSQMTVSVNNAMQMSNGHNLYRTANAEWLYGQHCVYTQGKCHRGEGTAQAGDGMLERERTGQLFLYNKFQEILYFSLSRQALSFQSLLERLTAGCANSINTTEE